MIQKKEEDRNGIYNLELEATGMNHLIVLSEGNDAVCCFMPLGEFFSHHIRSLCFDISNTIFHFEDHETVGLMQIYTQKKSELFLYFFQFEKLPLIYLVSYLS